MNIFRARAQNLIRALRESPDPGKFSMFSFVAHTCRTPACVLGHYAARRDLQDAFYLDYEAFDAVRLSADGSPAIPQTYTSALLNHFGFTVEEARELFSTRGCGGAGTIGRAISYIEGFIARKWPEDPAAKKLIDELNSTVTTEVKETA